MIRRLSSLAALLFLAAGAAAADDSGLLAAFQKRYASPAFPSARLSGSGQLYLAAGDGYLRAGPTEKALRVKEAFDAWRDTEREAGITPAPATLAVVWPAGGELWERLGSRVSMVDSWADDRPPTRAQRKTGQWFGFLGAQAQSGGSSSGSGVNARIGSTLWQDRYDLAATLGSNSTGKSPKVTSTSYGVVGRALFPLSKGIGWNAGAQLQRTIQSPGQTFDTVSAVGGLSFFVPSGSFDVTLTIGSHSTIGLTAGYTVFLTR